MAIRWLFGTEQSVKVADVVRRVTTSLILGALALSVLPQMDVPYPLQKIALLTAAELGLAGVMFGLFLGSKTYFAGVQLFMTPLLMLWLTSKHHAYSAIVIGLLSLGMGVLQLFTRHMHVVPRAHPADLVAAPAASTRVAAATAP